MSRIAYVNGRYLPHAHAAVACRGPRLSVRRRRLRSLRGAGRAPGRRAPPYGPARALARRTAHRACRCRARARRRDARDGAAQPRARRHRLSAGHARRGAARSCLSRRRARRRRSSSPRAATISARLEQRAAEGIAVDHRARISAGTASTSNRSRCCRTCWPSRRRASRGAQEAWFVDADGHVTEGASSNAWIVTRGRHAGHAAARQRHPARHHPHGRDRGAPRRRASTFEERAFHGRGGLCRARGLRHLGQPDRACRWCASTAARSAMARPACSPRRCAAPTMSTPNSPDLAIRKAR